MTKAIEIRGLAKKYDGGVTALAGIDLDIESGDFFALLGPNGAGKSTTIGIITTLVSKTAGSISVMGHDIETEAFQAKQLLGVVPQEFNFSIFDTCLLILLNQAGYYGVPRKTALQRAHDLLAALGLSDKTHTQAGKLSGGLKRRLMIARALMHQPKILILDEPTAGVDITLRRSMWDFLNEQNRQGLTIILTTHYLEEAEQLCNKIAIIDKGRIIENTSKRELLGKLTSETLQLECHGAVGEISLSGYSHKWIENVLEIQIHQDQTVTDVIHHLSTHNISVRRIQNKANRLEELFLELTGSA